MKWDGWGTKHRNVYTVLVGKPEGKELLGKPMHIY
jgi:hypothetical protein